MSRIPRAVFATGFRAEAVELTRTRTVASGFGHCGREPTWTPASVEPGGLGVAAVRECGDFGTQLACTASIKALRVLASGLPAAPPGECD